MEINKRKIDSYMPLMIMVDLKFSVGVGEQNVLPVGKLYNASPLIYNAANAYDLYILLGVQV